MPTPPAPASEARLWISELIDGRLDATTLARGCAGWEVDGELRRTWHAYHLIGDVLRSDELARRPVDDRAFLSDLRTRLRAEPAPLRPGPLRGARDRALRFGSARRALRWSRPLAVAAGFVAVAGVVVVLRDPAPSAGLVAGVGKEQFQPASAPASASPARMEFVRDEQLDRYLRFHRDALAGSPPALPGGALRSVEFEPGPAR